MQAAKLISIIFFPWKKYNEFFDKGCWGIWGLSPLLKYTLLYFALLFVPPTLGFVRFYEDNPTTDTYVMVYVLGLMVIAFIWFVYLPILISIVAKKTFLKTYKFTRNTVRYLTEDRQNVEETKPNDLEIIIRGLKQEFVSLIYKLGGWITKYYPFSLAFKDRLFHPNNAKLDKLVIKMATLARKNKVPIYVYGSEIEGGMYQFNTVFHKPVKNNSTSKLEKILQEKLGSVYVRKGEKGKLRIIMPIDSLDI